MLATRLTDWRDKSGRVIDDRVAPDLDPTERAALVDLLNALAGSSMLLELVDRQGHSPEKAAALARRAIDALLDDARRRRDAAHADRITNAAG